LFLRRDGVGDPVQIPEISCADSQFGQACYEMFFGKFFSLGLKGHAVLISVALISLTGLLGVRAYSVAKAHLSESKELVDREAPAQTLLFKIQSIQAALLRAEKKLKITADPVYSQLVANYRSSLSQEKKELIRICPELAGETDLVQSFQQKISSGRERKVVHARDVAAGLLRVIAAALILSVFITAWLSLLLYKGLLEPLRNLSGATTRIKEGDLTVRMGSCGIAELQSLSSSFNSMAERLETLDQAKRDFLAMISHELKNPIAALKEGLSLLSSKENALSENARNRCLSACLISSKRLEYMINNLLNSSKADSGLFEFEFAVHNVCKAVQRSVEEIRPLAEKKNIRIKVTGPEVLEFSFDWEGMIQALVNLLLNAIKYGDQNSEVEVKIIVQKETAPGSFIQISVENAGQEIGKAELDRVFERFYRGENSARQQGMGVGLHVVKQVVEAHSGVISALSQSGRTQMVIQLPLVFSQGGTT
jgi:signal transduction histidine kinase